MESTKLAERGVAPVQSNAMFGVAFPSSIKKPLIELCWLEEDVTISPFVCGLVGNPNGSLNVILDGLDEDWCREHFTRGTGSYLFEASWNEPQFGEYGRVELAGYWDLSFIAFKGVE